MRQIMLFLCMAGMAAASAQQKVEILRVGDYHGEEVSSDAAGRWWGLFAAGDGYELQSVNVTIETVFDAVLDREGETTGKRVSIDDERRPLILFRGIEQLEEGPVQTFWSGAAPTFLYPGETVSFREKKDRFVRLTAFGKAEEFAQAPGSVRISHYVLRLFSGYGTELRSQGLRTFDAVDGDGPPQLIWAGDLDRDGKTDLLMDLTYHYNVTVLTLFLSSQAEPGEIVGKAAEWVTKGC